MIKMCQDIKQQHTYGLLPGCNLNMGYATLGIVWFGYTVRYLQDMVLKVNYSQLSNYQNDDQAWLACPT